MSDGFTSSVSTSWSKAATRIEEKGVLAWKTSARGSSGWRTMTRPSSSSKLAFLLESPEDPVKMIDGGSKVP